MGTDINSRLPSALARFADALASAGGERVLFVLRVPALERIAWRQGRPRALVVERQATDAFAQVCRQTLRPADAIAHSAGSDLFLAALLGPTPSAGVPRTARAVLAEIARKVAAETGLEIECGWTLVEPDPNPAHALHAAVESAIERGSRERERFSFFAKIGHEMRTPLMSIEGFLATLLESDLDDAGRRHFTEIAQSEASRLRRLIERMYALSVIDLDAELPCDAACDAQRAIERACDAIYPVAAVRGTKLKVRSRVDFALPMIDEHAVQVFVGVLENAVKHGSERGRIEIFMQADRSGENLEIWFDDDGPGIPRDDRAAIFEPLVRGRDTVAPGHGLGLSIARAMVERAHGDMRVSRSSFGGARFIVRFPRAQTSADANANEFHMPITMRSP
jgi:signal transduction histidine kinase